MAGNTIGQLFRVTTFGESHGLALGAIVDGVPTGKADGKSILSVLALGIKSGQTVRVTVEGDDPDVLVAELKEILADPEG